MEVPAEVLTEIFSYLCFRDFLMISEVCKQFNSVISSFVFLKKISANLTNCGCFGALSRKYVNVKFGNAKNDEVENYLRKNRIWTSIQYCKFDNIDISRSETLTGIIGRFHNLKELHMEGIRVIDSSSNMCNIEIPQLESFKFFYCTNNCLKYFADCMQKLKIIKLCLLPHEDEESRNQSYNIVCRILHNNKFTLNKLNFYDVNFDDDFLVKISKIKFCQLFKFSMSFNSYLSLESLGFLSFVKQNAKDLEKFKIRTFDHVNQHHLNVLTKHATNLKSLNLIICSFCHYESFSGFKNLHKLEKLKIQPTNYCNAVATTHSCYKTFIENKVLSHKNENVKCLSIENILLSNEIIAKIISAFPNLETLFLPSAINSEFCEISLFKEKLKNLRQVVIDC